ncbi:M23 family metallopeptidase [Alishewanella sp. BS5-314]|uniref:M23 family metallopeptidase n=1 Tax=Alishewanella sp. BS5-314 TaxID=2755587 RepID=UPI0021BB3A4D|nr:M23 family metallopeptidase [Alishewanella sp. BS5-314]MCT8125994.1 M23 family metallopeptidase [Alishewanella sp. BS5-314]
MKVWAKALLLCALNWAALASSSAKELVLDGQLTQGSLIRATVPSGAKVWFNDQPLAVSEQGHFVFGIGRDAAFKHQLTVEHQGKRQQIPLTFSGRQYDIQRISGVEQKYVEPPKEVTARIARDNRRVREVRQTFSAKTLFLDTPLKPAAGRISGVYGSQRIFNGQPRNPHFGLDIAAPVGAPVLAPWDGKILLAEDLYFSGLTLIVDHGMGVTSTFMHLHRFNVAVGDTVTAGMQIAEVGATGRVTGPHLDWRINWFQERLDPQLLLPEFAPAAPKRIPLN